MRSTKWPVCLLLTLAFGLTGCTQGSTAETMDTTVTVETAAVEMGSLGIDGTYIGIISA